MHKTLAYAQELDAQDSLQSYKKSFHIPKQKNGEDYVYLCGNSLGLQPTLTESYLLQELEDWKNLGVEGHFHAKNPWMPYHEFLTPAMAKIVGAQPNEVVCMNTLTTNLHLLMVSFFRPTTTRYKIMMESDAFPSDRYMLQSQVAFHGFNPNDAIITISPRENEVIIRTEDLLATIDKHRDEIALILIGGVNYYTGQVFDMKTITQYAHESNIIVGFDLAHAAGNIPLELHNWNVDFAAWCTYKYLNSGPGSIAGLFVHEKHVSNKNLPKFAGWWGHNKQTRFNMRYDFDPIPSAESWQLSNPPILSLAAIRASLTIFQEIGMQKLYEKSKALNAYLLTLLQDVETSKVNCITPQEENQRGCQTSIQVLGADKSLFHTISQKGVIADWREPDVIRIAPVPLYNSFEDIYRFVKILNESI